MPYMGTSPSSVLANLDINGQKLILDADADTSITADTDDTIDIEIAGADDFKFTANSFNVLSGSTLTVDSGGTITNSGTANGFGVALANDANNRVVTGTGSGGLNGEANLTFDGTTLVVAGTVEPSGDTSAADNAAIGYTAAEGLILTGQGSTDDITIKNDADTTVVNVATGGTDIEVSAGNLLFGTASKGVYLGVTSATAANLLDDYEEGTYTLTITCGTSGSYGVSTDNDIGSYTKIGRHVFVVGQLNVTSESSPDGTLRLNLPFTTENSTEGANSGKTWFQLQNHGDGGIENACLITQHNVAYSQLQNITDAGSVEGIDQDRVDTNFHMSFAFHYLAA